MLFSLLVIAIELQSGGSALALVGNPYRVGELIAPLCALLLSGVA